MQSAGCSGYFQKECFGTRFHVQLGVLNGQRAGCCATAVDENPVVALALAGERQTEFLAKCKAHGDEADASGGSLLGGEVLRNLPRGTLLDDSVFSKASAVEVVGIGAVGDTGNSVAGLVALDAFGSDFDNGAAEVAANGGARGSQVVNVLPVLR